MKFTDGHWLNRTGVTIHSPSRVDRVTILQGGVVIVHAPTTRATGRGATLGGPVLTLRVSAPRPDVIRVQSTHFSGTAPSRPAFNLAEDPGFEPHVEQRGDRLRILSGDLALAIPLAGPFAMAFSWRGRPLTASTPGAHALVTVEGEGSYLREQLGLSVGETIYGLGERFTPFVKNGQSVEIWNEDGGTNTEQSYKNIPFYWSSRGYGVLANHPERVSYEIGTERVQKVQFSVRGETLDYLVIGGGQPKDVLSRYADLTGRPALPPAWSFGLWLTTSFTTDYDEPTVARVIEEMQSREIPLSVFHFDCFWMKAYEWVSFEWDRDAFADPEGMLARLHARGLKVSVWINPYVSQWSPLFAEAAEAGYLLHRPDGSVWQWDLWQPGMGIVDFTNPAARQWYRGHLRRLMAMGVDAFKTDFGERIPTDVVYFDGSDPARMHNYYAFLYNQVVFDTLHERENERPVVFARAATTGSQQFPVHWGGDSEASYESMAESLRGGLSLAASGFGFWSHDIGGFEGTPSADLYKRWSAFGLLSTHSRLHGNASYRVPWLFDEEAVDVLRHFARLKNRLMPYLYEQAVVAATEGIPMMRPMVLEFPDDPAVLYLDRQYLLGSSLLVAPIFDANGIGRYYLPRGRWVHWLSGAIADGPGWFETTYDYFSLPLFLRPGHLVAEGPVAERPDYDYGADVTVHLGSLEDGSTAEARVPDSTGRPALVLSVRRSGSTLLLSANGPAALLWRGKEPVAGADGATVQPGPHGVRIHWRGPVADLAVRLRT